MPVRSAAARRLPVIALVMTSVLLAAGCGGSSSESSSASSTTSSGNSSSSGDSSSDGRQTFDGPTSTTAFVAPPVPDACTLLTLAEAQGALPSAKAPAPPKPEEGESFCQFEGDGFGTSVSVLVKAVPEASIEELKKTDRANIAGGSKQQVDGVGDFAVYDSTLDGVRYFKGPFVVEVSVAGAQSDQQSLTALAKLTADRLN